MNFPNPKQYQHKEDVFYLHETSEDKVLDLANRTEGEFHTNWVGIPEAMSYLDAISNSGIKTSVETDEMKKMMEWFPPLTQIAVAYEGLLTLYFWTDDAPKISGIIRQFQSRHPLLQPIDIGIVNNYPDKDDRVINPTDSDSWNIVRVSWE